MYIQILYTVPVFLKNTNISNFYTAPTVLTDPNIHTHLIIILQYAENNFWYKKYC